MSFDTLHHNDAPLVKAPDGSDVRVMLQVAAASSIHVSLPPGATSIAVAHRTVEEIWYVLSGRGEMWRSIGESEDIVNLEPGVSITIPVGAAFQFRTLGDEPLTAFCVTMPPWPGMDEAYEVKGPWQPTATG